MTDTYELPELPESSRAILTGNVETATFSPVYTADQMRAYGQECARVERERIRALVLNDAWALTFQTFGQYRTAIAAAIRKG